MLSPRIDREAADGSAAGFIPRRSLAASPGSLLPSGRRGGEGSTPKPCRSSPKRRKGAIRLGPRCCRDGQCLLPCGSTTPGRSCCAQNPGGPTSLGFLHHAGTFFCIMPVQGGRRRGRVNSGVAMETGEDGWMAPDPCTRVPRPCGKQPSAPHSAGLRDPAAADHTLIRVGQENTLVIKLIALMTS